MEALGPGDPRPLTRRVFSGVAWSASARALTLLIQTATTVLLARLLTPSDFGLFALTLVFVGFGGVVTNLGLGTVLVQRRELTPAHLSTAFWLNEGVGAALTLLLMAMAPLIAAAFDEPELAGLIRLVALTFTLQVAVVPMALLERELRFRAIALVETLALGVGLVASLVAAVLGLGATALAIQSLVSATALSLFALVAARWWPRARPTRVALGDIWALSGWFTAGSVVGYWSLNADTLLLGATQPPAQIGYYNRAYNLLLLPLQSMGNVVTRVVVPALATMQEDDERSRAAWLRSAGGLALVAFPTCVGMAAAAPALVETLWGQTWLPVIPLLQLLAIAGIPWVLAVAAEWVLFARGRARRFFWLAMANTAITVAAVVAGLPWGAPGVAAAVLVRSVLILPVYTSACLAEIQVSARDVLGLTLRPLLASAAMGGLVLALGIVLVGPPPIVTLTAQVLMGVVCYAGLVGIGSPASRRQLVQALRGAGSGPVSAAEVESEVGPTGPGARPTP